VIRAALALLAVLAAPGHVEPQISEAPAGSRTTFGFLVEHGCDDSPTVAVSIQLPDGAFDAVPQPPAGWTGVVEDGQPPVVTFTGGPLAADVEETFAVELVTPNRPGETVLFPTVQACEAGEIGWIDPAEGAEEPAPRIVLTENAQPILPSTTTPAPPTTVADDEGPASTTTTPPAESGDEDEGSDGDDDGGGEAVVPTLLVGLAIGVGVVVYRRTRSRT
jgi:uncharacterized protein YcnI